MKKHKNLDSHYRIMFYIINNIIETMGIFRQNLGKGGSRLRFRGVIIKKLFFSFIILFH